MEYDKLTKKKEAQKRWREKNQERIKQKNREYYLTLDREILNEQQRRRRENDPEYEKLWRMNNSESIKARYKKAYTNNKESFLKRSHDYRERNPNKAREIARRSHLRKYNITLEDYDFLLRNQNGVCYLCKGEPDEGKNLYIDHDHQCCDGNYSCGSCIRGLVHLKCNTIIAYAGDNPSFLRQLAMSLEEIHVSRNER